MAKYTVEHSCGHTQVHVLFGPTKDRERKLEWMATQPCTECWAAQKRAEEAKKPIIITIHSDGLIHGDGIWVEAAAAGGTEPRKDELKARGWRWGEIRGGIMDYLSTKGPAMGWTLAKLCKSKGDIDSTLQYIKAEAEYFGAEVVNGLATIEQMALKESLAQLASQPPAPPKPAKPVPPEDIIPAGKYWNRKIYGNEKYGYRIYLDSKETRLSTEQVARLQEYLKEVAK